MYFTAKFTDLRRKTTGLNGILKKLLTKEKVGI
jgi:hypothetical protein